jgi:succinoglycan biosynthesis protein ExoM
MSENQKHITVCICTYKRPGLLRKLLENLCIQETDNLFSISASIVDNDMELSAKPIIDDFLKSNNFELTYAHNPERNLALLRNISVENSKGDYIAFIDDDECPINNWLLLLYKTLDQYQASGVFGPVLPKYQIKPPRWVEQGKLFERKRLKTGADLSWWHTRTGNALLKRNIFFNPGNRFDLKFKVGGEDDTLFERLINKGYRFVWCDEAVAFEEIPASRIKVAYFIKRSQLIGFINYSYLKDTRSWIQKLLIILRSIFALLIYFILLPLYLLRGYHYFVKLLIRFYYHRGVVLTFLGLLKFENRDI